MALNDKILQEFVTKAQAISRDWGNAAVAVKQAVQGLQSDEQFSASPKGVEFARLNSLCSHFGERATNLSKDITVLGLDQYPASQAVVNSVPVMKQQGLAAKITLEKIRSENSINDKNVDTVIADLIAFSDANKACDLLLQDANSQIKRPSHIRFITASICSGYDVESDKTVFSIKDRFLTVTQSLISVYNLAQLADFLIKNPSAAFSTRKQAEEIVALPQVQAALNDGEIQTLLASVPVQRFMASTTINSVQYNYTVNIAPKSLPKVYSLGGVGINSYKGLNASQQLKFWRLYLRNTVGSDLLDKQKVLLAVAEPQLDLVKVFYPSRKNINPGNYQKEAQRAVNQFFKKPVTYSYGVVSSNQLSEADITRLLQKSDSGELTWSMFRQGKYPGNSDDKKDIKHRLNLTQAIVARAKSMVDSAQAKDIAEDKCLNVLLLPEFFYRGSQGLYTDEQGELSDLLAGLRTLVEDEAYARWVVAFGTVLVGSEVSWNLTANRELTQVERTQLEQDKNEGKAPSIPCAPRTLVTNFALVQQGGIGHGNDQYAHYLGKIIQKSVISGIDFLRHSAFPIDGKMTGANYVTQPDVLNFTGAYNYDEGEASPFSGGGLFELNNVQFSLEVCLDFLAHRMANYKNSHPGMVAVDAQLVVSCGAPPPVSPNQVADARVSRDGGYMVGCDGLNDCKGWMIATDVGNSPVQSFPEQVLKLDELEAPGAGESFVKLLEGYFPKRKQSWQQTYSEFLMEYPEEITSYDTYKMTNPGQLFLLDFGPRKIP